jgi:hypothetical protein
VAEDEDFYYFEPIPGGTAHAIQIGGHQFMVIHRRKFYRGFNETPTKEGPMPKNAKIAKLIVKTVAGLAVSTAIGQLYKFGKQMDAKIDDYYDVKKDDTDDSDLDN